MSVVQLSETKVWPGCTLLRTEITCLFRAVGRRFQLQFSSAISERNFLFKLRRNTLREGRVPSDPFALLGAISELVVQVFFWHVHSHFHSWWSICLWDRKGMDPSTTDSLPPDALSSRPGPGSGPGSGSPPEGPPQKKRVSSACQRCRQQKLKASLLPFNRHSVRVFQTVPILNTSRIP